MFKEKPYRTQRKSGVFITAQVAEMTSTNTASFYILGTSEPPFRYLFGCVEIISTVYQPKTMYIWRGLWPTHRIHVWYIYLHEWLILVVHVGKYTIHGSYGNYIPKQNINKKKLNKLGQSLLMFFWGRVSVYPFQSNVTNLYQSRTWREPELRFVGNLFHRFSGDRLI